MCIENVIKWGVKIIFLEFVLGKFSWMEEDSKGTLYLMCFLFFIWDNQYLQPIDMILFVFFSKKINTFGLYCLYEKFLILLYGYLG